MVVLAGGLCAAVVSGLVGQLLALVLISVGLAAIVLLVFLEVGLSEDRARSQEEALRRQADKPSRGFTSSARVRGPRWPRRPG